MVGEGGLDSLALGLAEREVSFPPHDQCGPVGEGGQAGFDLAGVLGCGDELAGGDDSRCAAVRVAPWREVQIAHFPGDRLREAAAEEEPGHEVEPAGEGPADRPAHQPPQPPGPRPPVWPRMSGVISRGRRAAKPRPMGPPQSWTMSVMLVRPSSPARRSSSWLCSRGRKLKPGAAVDMPYPGKSGATQRNSSLSPAMILR